MLFWGILCPYIYRGKGTFFTCITVSLLGFAIRYFNKAISATLVNSNAQTQTSSHGSPWSKHQSWIFILIFRACQYGPKNSLNSPLVVLIFKAVVPLHRIRTAKLALFSTNRNYNDEQDNMSTMATNNEQESLQTALLNSPFSHEFIERKRRA